MQQPLALAIIDVILNIKLFHYVVQNLPNIPEFKLVDVN
jgi:hypothetical protein